MAFVTKVISAEDVITALQYDYDRYVISYMMHCKDRRPMSTVFDVQPVMMALAAEITNQGDFDKAAERVVKTITNQGVDRINATLMAVSGRDRLITAIGLSLGNISMKSLEGGNIDIIEHGDTYITFNDETV